MNTSHAKLLNWVIQISSLKKFQLIVSGLTSHIIPSCSWQHLWYSCYRQFPFYLLCTLLSYPFHLLPSPMHPTGFSLCFLPGFLATITLLSSQVMYAPDSDESMTQRWLGHCLLVFCNSQNIYIWYLYIYRIEDNNII